MAVWLCGCVAVWLCGCEALQLYSYGCVMVFWRTLTPQVAQQNLVALIRHTVERLVAEARSSAGVAASATAGGGAATPSGTTSPRAGTAQYYIPVEHMNPLSAAARRKVLRSNQGDTRAGPTSSSANVRARTLGEYTAMAALRRMDYLLRFAVSSYHGAVNAPLAQAGDPSSDGGVAGGGSGNGTAYVSIDTLHRRFKASAVVRRCDCVSVCRCVVHVWLWVHACVAVVVCIAIASLTP